MKWNKQELEGKLLPKWRPTTDAGSMAVDMTLIVDDILKLVLLFFRENKTFHANYLLGR